jgi:aminopeptidase N
MSLRKTKFYAFVLSLIILNLLSVAQSGTSRFYGTYNIVFYYLDLQVTNKNTDISGVARIDALLMDNSTDTLYLELTDSAEIDSVRVNGTKCEFIHEDDLIKINCFFQPNSKQLVSLEVFYSLQNIENPDYKGIYHKTLSDGKEVTWTLSEPFYSKNWFPCKQDLQDKADSSWVFLTLDTNLLAGSNGLLRDIVNLGGGKKRLEWKSTYPIAYYLISFAVGDYMDYSFMAATGDGDSVLVQNFIYNDSIYFQNNKSQIDATADMIENFSFFLGTYPFKKEKYGHCIAPVGGGMEHQTMTTLGNFGFQLVAHELAHQWYGNQVTCSNWQDIWVNEGFASYGELMALEDLKPDEVASWISETHAWVLSRNDGSVYVPATELSNVNRIFDYRLTYRKGASIIHMLRHELSDPIFFSVLRSFQDRFADSTATAIDFREVAEELSGRNLEDFFEQWYYGEGHPIIGIRWQQKNDSLIIYAEQQASAPEKTPFFNMLIDFRVDFLGGDTLVQFRQKETSQIFSIYFPFRVYRLIPDPDEWLLREISGVSRIMPDDSASLFHVFPNPVNHEVYIENFEIGRPFNIQVFDNKGILVTETTGKDAFTEVNMTSFSPGVYQFILSAEGIKEIYQIAKL